MHIITIDSIIITIITTSSPIAIGLRTSYENAVMRQTANFHKAELLLPSAKLHTCSYVHASCFSQICHFRPMTPTQPTKSKNSRPITNPTQPMGQPNPWTTLGRQPRNSCRQGIFLLAERYKCRCPLIAVGVDQCLRRPDSLRPDTVPLCYAVPDTGRQPV